MTQVLFCAQMLKWNVFYIMIIHEPLRSRGGLYRNNCCRWCACGVPVAFLLFWQSPPPPLLSFSSRTKTSSSTWTTAGTSWACRMSRWATAGCLLARPTSSTVTALRLAVSTLEMLLVCPLVVESRQCGGRMKCMLSLENWVSCACLCACCRNVETENT